MTEKSTKKKKASGGSKKAGQKKSAIRMYRKGKTLKQISALKTMPTEKTLRVWRDNDDPMPWIEANCTGVARLFEDVGILEKEVEGYFISLMEVKGRWTDPNKDGERLFIAELHADGSEKQHFKRPPTWSGLAVALHTTRLTLQSYLDGDKDNDHIKYSEILKGARDVIRAYMEGRMVEFSAFNGTMAYLINNDDYENKAVVETISKKSLEDYVLGAKKK